VVLDTLLVFVPLSFVVGWLSGGAYTQEAAGNTTYGMNVTDRPFLLLLALGIAYYIACETVTGATLGKRMVGIRVVGEDGEPVTFGAAIVRNLVRIVDAFFFYFVAFISALLSKRRQRLGDRAAHTIVVRR
jgi:uncharacterized RDD family membrane protein YckC